MTRHRHVTTCLGCGWREAVRPGRAYATRCPNDGRTLEHFEALLSRQELRDITRDGQVRRFTGRRGAK